MQAGDILFYRGDRSIPDSLVRWWTSGPFCHVEIAINDTESIGALAQGIVRHAAPKADAVYSLQTSAPVSPDNLAAALAWLEAQVGDPYSYADIVDDVYRKFWRRAPLLIQRHAYDCSDLASHFLIAAHTGFTVSKKAFLQPETISPNELARLVGLIK